MTRHIQALPAPEITATPASPKPPENERSPETPVNDVLKPHTPATATKNFGPVNKSSPGQNCVRSSTPTQGWYAAPLLELAQSLGFSDLRIQAGGCPRLGRGPW